MITGEVLAVGITNSLGKNYSLIHIKKAFVGNKKK
jgi:hypothetical protein